MKGIYVLLSGLLLSLANPIGSFAHERYNHLPHQVINTLEFQYGNFDLIHSTGVYKHGRLRYNLLIQHRRGYLGVTIGAHGRLLSQNRYHKYPLANHYCNNECRFHFQHYRGNGFVWYDPLIGCNTQVALVHGNHGHSHYASLGHSDWYYHPQQKHYKRLKQPKNGYHAHKQNRNRKNGSRSYHQEKSGSKYQKHPYRDDRYYEQDHSARQNKTSKHSNDSEAKGKYKQRGHATKKDRRGNYVYYVDPSYAHARGNGR